MSSQLLAVAYSGVQFASFELFTKWCAILLPGFHDNMEGHRAAASVVNFSCGCLAGVTSAVVTQPLDVLKTRFIAQGEPRIYRNLNDAILTIAKKEGLYGFFRGMSPSILLTAPQTGLGFATYKFILSLINLFETRILGHPPSDPNTVGLVSSATAGAIAGMTAKLVVYPMDVAKKRLQVQGFEEARSPFGRHLIVGGLRDCIVKTWRNEGMEGIFKGLQPSIFKACVSMGMRFTVYEQTLNFLSRKRITKPEK